MRSTFLAVLLGLCCTALAQSAAQSAETTRASFPEDYFTRDSKPLNVQPSIETAQVIEELLDLARQMREAQARGDNLGLTEDEIAFYDALEVNDSAVKILGDEQLREIAKDIADTVRKNASIDWHLREQARANLRRMVKRVLRTHGYPPDKQEKASQTVIEQAELFAQYATQ